MDVSPVGAALTIQTDGHETNRRLSRLCERVYKCIF